MSGKVQARERNVKTQEGGKTTVREELKSGTWNNKGTINHSIIPEVYNIDCLITMQCAAEKPSLLAITPLDMHPPHQQCLKWGPEIQQRGRSEAEWTRHGPALLGLHQKWHLWKQRPGDMMRHISPLTLPVQRWAMKRDHSVLCVSKYELLTAWSWRQH